MSVECDLRVIGLKEEVRRFFEFAKGEDRELGKMWIDFAKFRPDPSAITRDLFVDSNQLGIAESEKYAYDWYAWRAKTLGSQWRAVLIARENDVIDDEKCVATVTFHTPWLPPQPMVLMMSRSFCNLTFDLRYFCRSAGFNGELRCKEGKIIKEGIGEYFGDRGGAGPNR
jgi:hypothetical protein